MLLLALHMAAALPKAEAAVAAEHGGGGGAVSCCQRAPLAFTWHANPVLMLPPSVG